MADPFEAVVPIGKKPEATGLSAGERRYRGPAGDHSELRAPRVLTSTDPATGAPKEPAERRTKKRQRMTTEELKVIAERIIRKAAGDAVALEKASDRKHAATAAAIMIDKLTMLSGKPTQIHEVRGEERDGLKRLAEMLARDSA